MAIKRGLNKTLAEIGKIKTGYKGEMMKSANGVQFQPPKKLDYFIVTTTERDAKTGNMIQNGDLMTKLGKTPREIKIRLPFDSIDKNFFTQYQAYDGGKKICAGDGETADRVGVVTVTDGKKLKIVGAEKSRVVCDFETCPIAQAGKCKVSGILSAFLPQSGDLGGVYKYRTHSWNGVSSILAALEFFAANTGGILQGLPLKLVLIKKTTEEHGTINYATVVIDGEEIHGLRKLALEEKTSRLQLGYDIKVIEAAAEQSGFFTDTDTPEDIEAEFYAESEPVNVTPAKGTAPADLGAKIADRSESAKPAEKVEPEPVAEKLVIGVPPRDEPRSMASPVEPAQEKPSQDLDIF